MIGARIRPLKVDGKPWDGDHTKVPQVVYRIASTIAGLPPLSVLAAVPYRNRPDPYLIVLAGEKELARSRSLQGTFVPPLYLPVTLPEKLPATLTFVAMDDDIRNDDAIGKAVVATKELFEKPGLHVLEGTAGLADVRVVVRAPGAGTGDLVQLQLDKIHVKVKKRRPAGGDWDAGGNPLKGKLPKKLPLPDDLEGLEMLRPDLVLRAIWTAGGERESTVSADSWVRDWKDVDLQVEGRRGRGDGLILQVRDEDPALDDPVGLVWVPFEDFWKARAKGLIRLEADELSGIDVVEIGFHIPGDE